jgi:hypothetical protein
MKTKLKYLLLTAVLLGDLCQANAQATAFTYQGRLNDGASPATGTYDLQFTLYNNVTNGLFFGTLTNSATGITNGLFTTTLDFGPGVFTGSNSGNTMTVYWQNVFGWNLQQNNDLSQPSNWSASGGVTASNGTNYLQLASPTGNLFFRLQKP